MNKNDFGHWLKERRVDLGLSQAAVAVKLAVSQATISAWEKGHKHPSDTERARVVKSIAGDGFLTTEMIGPNQKAYDVSLEMLARVSQALNQAGVQKLGYSRLLSIYQYVADVEGKLGNELNEDQMLRFVVDT